MYLKSNIEKLKNRKRQLGWTNQKLAEESGVPVGTLNKIFNGTTRYPRDKTLNAMVDAMGMNFYDIEDAGVQIPMLRESGVYQAIGGPDKRATLGTYYSLPKELRVELIDGKFYYMSAPTLQHQEILSKLSGALYSYFCDKKEEYHVFVSPSDVCLDNDNYTMLEPDIFVVRGKSKIVNGSCCEGAPEFVIEIVSPMNPEHDYDLKRRKYQNAGVKEYWIVDPVKMRIVVYVFSRDSVPSVYTFEDKVRPYLYPDLGIDFERMKREMV